MAFGGTVAIRAMKDGDYLASIFPGTTAGLQAAIDYLAGGKGKVMIGPGTLSLTTVIYIHGGCTIEGCGADVTILQRASGSLTSGDAQYTGCMFFATPYGSASPPNAGTFQSDISIRMLTMDGNYSAFGSVDPSTPRHMGVYFFFVQEFRLLDCEVKNFLQNGVYLDACRNCVLGHLRLTSNGQYASPSSRNSIDVSNTQSGAIAAGFATNFTLDDIISTSPLDEHLDIANCNNVAVSNMVCTGGDIVLEIQGDTTRTSSISGLSFVNVRSTGNTGAFITNNVSAGVSLSDVNVSNCSMTASASAHNRPAVVVSQGATAVPVTRFIVDNCIFQNINSSDASGIPMVDISGTSAQSYVMLRGCIFNGGAPASVRTNCHGLQVQSSISRLMIDSCTFSTVAGVGLFIAPGSGQTISDSFVQNTIVSTSNNDGYQFVENTSSSGVIKNLSVAASGSIDANRQTGNQCFRVGALSAAGGGSVSYVQFSGCYGYKNSGANPARGIDFGKGAGGTTDEISANGCNFRNLAAPYNNSSGTPTNLHCEFPYGRGSDITAAATISIPTNGTTFHVTGNTNITNGITVNPWDNGRTVALVFEGTPTVSNTGTSKLAGNFVAAGTTNDFDTLSLLCDGTNWYETARSAN